MGRREREGGGVGEELDFCFYPSTRMHSEGYSSWFVCVCVCVYVCVSVCVCVHSYSGTTGYRTAYERYQRLQNNEILINKKAIFLKRLHSGDMA